MPSSQTVAASLAWWMQPSPWVVASPTLQTGGCKQHLAAAHRTAALTIRGGQPHKQAALVREVRQDGAVAKLRGRRGNKCVRQSGR